MNVGNKPKSIKIIFFVDAYIANIAETMVTVHPFIRNEFVFILVIIF